MQPLNPLSSSTAPSGVHHSPLIAEENILKIDLAPLPTTSGPTTSSKKIPEHAAQIKEKTRKHPRTFLHINARSILSTLKLMKSGFGAMGALFIEKSKGIGVIPATIGFLLAGSSILVQAAIKALIWVPLSVGTAVVGGATASIGAVLGTICAALCRDPSLVLKGAELGFSIGDKAGWILGTAGVTLSGFSIVARWPLMLTSELGIWLLKKSAPQDKELQEKRGFLVDLADRVAYEDSFLLWVAGHFGVWDTVFHSINKSKEITDGHVEAPIILQALEAGANLYSHGTFGNSLSTRLKWNPGFEDVNKIFHYRRYRFENTHKDYRADMIIDFCKKKVVYDKLFILDKENNNFLHLAAQKNDSSTINTLSTLNNTLSTFKDFTPEFFSKALSAFNKDKKTPLELAIEAGNWDFVGSVFDFSKDLYSLLTVKNSEGDTLEAILSRTKDIPQDLASTINKKYTDLYHGLEETIKQQTEELRELKKRLNEEPPPIPDNPDTSSSADLLALNTQRQRIAQEFSQTRKRIWARRADHADQVPIFLLPNQKDLESVSLTMHSFESNAAGSTIPPADPRIDITQLIIYLTQIQSTLPLTISDEGTIRSQKNMVEVFVTRINGLANNGVVKDQYNNTLSVQFKRQVINALRHITKSLVDQETAILTTLQKKKDDLMAELNKKLEERKTEISAAPEAKKLSLQAELNHYQRVQKAEIEDLVKKEETDLKNKFNADLKEILWERLCVDFFHCHDRLATDCESIYYERLGLFRESLPDRIRDKLFQFRRNLFDLAVAHVPNDKHVAATHRHYRALLGPEFRIGSTELSQENAQYSGFAVKGQEGRIRKEMREGLAPANIAAYIARVIGDPKEKAITPALVTTWIQENYPEFVNDFFLEDESWNPMAIAIMLEDLNIFKWIGVEKPLRFSQKPLLPPPAAGKHLSLEHRLQIFDHYVERVAENRDFGGLSKTIIDFRTQWKTLLGAIDVKDEKKLNESHQKLHDYLEKKWNDSFQQLIAECNKLAGSGETLPQDLKILQNAYDQLMLFDGERHPELTTMPQFQKIQEEKTALKEKINSFKEKLNASTSEEITPPAEDVSPVMEKDPLGVTQMQTSNAQKDVENDLKTYLQEKERCRQDKAGLQKLLDTITLPQVRQKFSKAGLTEALRGLMQEIREVQKQLK